MVDVTGLEGAQPLFSWNSPARVIQMPSDMTGVLSPAGRIHGFSPVTVRGAAMLKQRSANRETLPELYGGRDGTRTRDLVDANHALSRLSYTPISDVGCRAAFGWRPLAAFILSSCVPLESTPKARKPESTRPPKGGLHPNNIYHLSRDLFHRQEIGIKLTPVFRRI